MDLRRLILTIKPDGHELRVFYRRASGSGPSTKKRQREVEQLAREGLRHDYPRRREDLDLMRRYHAEHGTPRAML